MLYDVFSSLSHAVISQHLYVVVSSFHEFPAFSWVLSLWLAGWLHGGVVSRVCRVSRVSLSAYARGPAESNTPGHVILATPPFGKIIRGSYTDCPWKPLVSFEVHSFNHFANDFGAISI